MEAKQEIKELLATRELTESDERWEQGWHVESLSTHEGGEERKGTQTTHVLQREKARDMRLDRSEGIRVY